MVFRPVRTYNCIIKLSNLPQNEFKYSVMKKTDNISKELTGVSFNRLKIDALNKNGWILVNEKTLENINRIEGQSIQLKIIFEPELLHYEMVYTLLKNHQKNSLKILTVYIFPSKQKLLNQYIRSQN